MYDKVPWDRMDNWESHMYILGVTSIEVMSFIGHGTLMADSDITLYLWLLTLEQLYHLLVIGF